MGNKGEVEGDVYVCVGKETNLQLRREWEWKKVNAVLLGVGRPNPTPPPNKVRSIFFVHVGIFA